MDAEAMAGDLLRAFEAAEPIAPPSAAHDLTVADAYAIQRALVAGHARAGRTVAGSKIGLTSAAMRQQLGVDSPDFGVLLDTHLFRDGEPLSRAGLKMLQPRLEAEVAFVLSAPLGAGTTATDVLAATESVLPVFEVIDSRIADWKITLVDTIADNASCFGAVLGARVAPADAGPLDELHVRATRDGEEIAAGPASAVMGHPAAAVAWLAETLGELGEQLPAGQPILSGSFTAAWDAEPGEYVADFGPLGAVRTVIEP